MKNKIKTSTFPVASILALIFITLKLANIGVVATWSWLWVLAPLWIPTALALIITLIFIIYLINKS